MWCLEHSRVRYIRNRRRKYVLTGDCRTSQKVGYRSNSLCFFTVHTLDHVSLEMCTFGCLVGKKKMENLKISNMWKELQTGPIHECRYDERLKTKAEESTRLGYTGFGTENPWTGPYISFQVFLFKEGVYYKSIKHEKTPSTSLFLVPHVVRGTIWRTLYHMTGLLVLATRIFLH